MRRSPWRWTPLVCFLVALTCGTSGAEPPPIESIAARLQANAAVRATFAETRVQPFRREPQRLVGEMRFDPQLGLSLHYREPVEQILIVDETGVLMRDDRGRERAAPAKSAAASGTRPLLQVLRFDLSALRETFALQWDSPAADAAAEAWQLTLIPRPEFADALNFTRLIVTGEADRVLALQWIHDARRRVEIIITDSESQVTFSAAERDAYFR